MYELIIISTQLILSRIFIELVYCLHDSHDYPVQFYQFYNCYICNKKLSVSLCKMYSPASGLPNPGSLSVLQY